MIIADAKDVKQALAAISKREGKGTNTTPYLQLSAQGNTCTLRLSDGEWHDASVTLDVERDAKLKPRRMILPTGLLHAALKPVTKRGVEFKLGEAAGKRPFWVGELQTTVTPGTNMPKPDEWECVNTDEAVPWFTIPAGDLLELLADVSFAVSTDYTRSLLTAVYLAVKRNRLTAVATDTYRLATGSAKVKMGKRLAGYALLPAPTLRNVEKALSAVAEEELVTVAAVRPGKSREDAKALSFTIGNRQVRGLCIEGTYVNYQRICDSGAPEPEACLSYKWEADAEETRAALTSLKPLADSDAKRVVGHLRGGAWHLSAMELGPDADGARVEIATSTIAIPAEVIASEKPEFTHAFNGEYMLDYLDRLGSGSVTIETDGPLNQLRCSCGKRGLYIQMPMQVM